MVLVPVDRSGAYVSPSPPNPPPLPGWVAFGCYPAGIILVAIAGKLCGPDE